MRIRKNNTQVTAAADTQIVEKVPTYDDAIVAIRSAIEALGDAAKAGDTLAKESIANLSVVLFDLQ